jgi:hypothetical protein
MSTGYIYSLRPKRGSFWDIGGERAKMTCLPLLVGDPARCAGKGRENWFVIWRVKRRGEKGEK